MLREQLLNETAELVDIASVSRDEAVLAAHVAETLGAVALLDVIRIGDNVIARTDFGLDQRVLLAGHLDTVPAAGNETAVLESDRCRGLGSADMKGGLAVLLALARALDAPRHDLTLVFYAREEIARAHSGLLEIEAARPDLLEADVALLLEPTSAHIEAGCQGVARLEVILGGRRAHSARPWVGVNAIHRLAPLLALVAGFEERRPVIEGCTYRETLQAVAIGGGVAGNVVPDEVHLTLSHRFAPDRRSEEAIEILRELLAPALDPELGDRIELLDVAPPAPPALGHPVIAELLEASGEPAEAKIAWTDVAFFAERGIPAANFGPGDPLVAHRADESVSADDLERVFRSLSSVLTAS